MSILEAIRIAIGSILSNKLRSFLTLLGTIISISSIVAVISVINGLNIYVEESISNLGKGVFVISKFGVIHNRDDLFAAIRRNKNLRLQDGLAIKKACDLVDEVGVEIHASAKAKRENLSIEGVDVGGITESILDIEPFEIDAGRNFTRSEIVGRSYAVFLGNDVREALFPDTDPIGKKITVGQRRFLVVGAAKKRGSVFGMSRDNYVKIPITTFQKIYGTWGSVNISCRKAPGVPIDEAMDQARVVLRSRHHLKYKDEDDFGIVTSDGLNDLWKNLTAAIFSIATFVVGISLVVSGIVIMNIMLVAVIERTREIGVRKAVGATNRDITRQFLVESVILSCLGGFLGLLLAAALSVIIQNVSPLPARFPLWAPPMAFFICTTIGIFFGLNPARKASRLDPIEALRAE